ncbi:SPOSA6832_01232, partial [Sporobolomyces salmonicolor]
MSGVLPGTGTIIYDSVKPLIRILLTVGIGFLLIKLKVIPSDGTKVCSLLIVNVTLPSLLFSKVVPSFTSQNIGALAPIFITGIFYQALSAVIGFVARGLTPTPRRFRYGMIAAYGKGMGDLPIGVIQSLMSSAPFNPATDEDLGVAYTSIFILINYVSMFPLQGLRLVKVDYLSPPSASLERRYEDGEFGTLSKWLHRFLAGMPMRHEVEEERERHLVEDVGTPREKEGTDFEDEERRLRRSRMDSRMTSVGSTTSTMVGDDHGISCCMDDQIVDPSDPPPKKPYPSDFSVLEPGPLTPPPNEPELSRARKFWNGAMSVVNDMIVPPTVSLVISLVVALVPALRALFVPPESASASFDPRAPDGNPPLSTIFGTFSFIGAASVPLGLLVLGGSIAKIEIPRPVSRLPISSIITMALVKLAFLPIIGFFFVKALVRAGMVDADNAVLRFGACVPTATNQVVWSQILAPPGTESNSALLGAYLLAQYICWSLSSVLLTAFSLHTIF